MSTLEKLEAANDRLATKFKKEFPAVIDVTNDDYLLEVRAQEADIPLWIAKAATRWEQRKKRYPGV